MHGKTSYCVCFCFGVVFFFFVNAFYALYNDGFKFRWPSELLLYFLLFPGIPDNGNANSWNVSMEQCKNSHPPYYLLGNISLDDPQYICNIIIHQSQVVWIGVVRHIYTSTDQGILISSFIFEIFVQQSKNCMIQRIFLSQNNNRLWPEYPSSYFTFKWYIYMLRSS